jgi:hypothetical protein
MKRRSFLALLGLSALACSSGPEDPPNPERLWLALDGSEIEVRLLPEEPDPF